jgi:hypothetical protein
MRRQLSRGGEVPASEAESLGVAHPGSVPPGWVLEWRWLAVLGCGPPSLMLLLMCCMPETPRFLLTQHKRQEAMAALQFLWGSEQGWEEPPIGAEHQVRGGSRSWGETIRQIA